MARESFPEAAMIPILAPILSRKPAHAHIPTPKTIQNTLPDGRLRHGTAAVSWCQLHSAGVAGLQRPALEVLVDWFVLITSGMFEAVWATALGQSNGLTRLWPSVIFFAALVVSMGGLAWAMKTLPTGTSYAIWVGVGASLAVIYAMVTGSEPVTVAKILLITGLIGCVVGLQLVS